VVHFIHRNLAYLITILVFIGLYDQKNNQHFIQENEMAALAFVLLQLIVGIITVIKSPHLNSSSLAGCYSSIYCHVFIAIVGLSVLSAPPKKVNGLIRID
jgi:heme A synthase